MKWIKKGLIYGPDGKSTWARHSALTPTPLLVNKDIIRVYAGFRDDQGISRIGFVDVEAQDPSRIMSVSKAPALDIGRPGAFDDNGVILGDIVQYESKLYMYYVGFQKTARVKFLAFTGLAVSSDGGITFKRYSDVPVLDRSNNEIYIRAIHSIFIEIEKWRIWYASGNGWEWINGNPYPKYHIRCLETPNGIDFPEASSQCIELEENEYRMGRPRIYKRGDNYFMFFTKGTLRGDYLPGYAISRDGTNWIRKDDQIGISLSESGWDSKSLCYPALIDYEDKTYMFYNGNNMGYDGFGYAVCEEWPN